MITDLQELFDKVLAHSRTMTEQSFGGGRCLYRDGRGNKCFIGALIPDDKYVPELESPYSFANCMRNFAGIHDDLIEKAGKLQRIHDEHFDDREQKLANFATVNNLKYSPPVV